MKLIPMADYTLKVVQTPNVNEAHCWEQTAQRLDKIYFYALFLKTPLEIGMFVPVNTEGNILSDPMELISEDNETDSIKLNEYFIAIKKVFFRGVVIEKVIDQLSNEWFIGITVNGQWCGGWDSFISSYLNGNKTIEGLTTLKEKLLPELNGNGLKQIEGANIWNGYVQAQSNK